MNVHQELSILLAECGLARLVGRRLDWGRHRAAMKKYSRSKGALLGEGRVESLQHYGALLKVAHAA